MRDHYAVEARDEYVTELDNVMYIIIALVKVKTSKYLSKTNKFWTKLEVEKKIHNPYVSFDIVIFAISSNNNGNMVVIEIPEFFQFPKRDISTARCKCTIYIITNKSIKVVIRTEFINTTVLFSTWGVFVLFFFFNWFFLPEAKFNSFLKEIVLVMRNCCIIMSEIEL